MCAFYFESENRKMCICDCARLELSCRGWSVVTAGQHETLLLSDHASMEIFEGKVGLTAHSKQRYVTALCFSLQTVKYFE